jgi:hypothetical protein
MIGACAGPPPAAGPAPGLRRACGACAGATQRPGLCPVAPDRRTLRRPGGAGPPVMGPSGDSDSSSQTPGHPVAASPGRRF